MLNNGRMKKYSVTITAIQRNTLTTSWFFLIHSDLSLKFSSISSGVTAIININMFNNISNLRYRGGITQT